MFQHQKIWLPDGEKHFPEWMTRNGEIVDGKGTYQIKKFREAMKWVKRFDAAVDVGGHVGLWSMHMAKRFAYTVAFEPVAQFRECFKLNAPDAILYPVALGAVKKYVGMNVDASDTGGTHVKGDGDVVMLPLDEYDLAPDFIKIDCEGYELEVLKGAEETLVRHHPCVIVEQKPHKLLPNFGIKGAPAVDFLIKLGAIKRKEIGGDFILSWD